VLVAEIGTGVDVFHTVLAVEGFLCLFCYFVEPSVIKKLLLGEPYGKPLKLRTLNPA
jgi:hypothetical protein